MSARIFGVALLMMISAASTFAQGARKDDSSNPWYEKSKDVTPATAHLFKLKIRSDENCTVQVNNVAKGHLQALKTLTVYIPVGMNIIEGRADVGADGLYYDSFRVDRSMEGMEMFYDMEFSANDKKPTIAQRVATESYYDTTKVFTFTERMPEYAGGMPGLMHFVDSVKVYPKTLGDSGVEGRVMVRFVINRNGSVSDVKVAKKVHPALDAEAVRIANLLRFTPGMQHGRIVRVQFNLPVIFQARPGEKDAAKASTPDTARMFRLSVRANYDCLITDHAQWVPLKAGEVHNIYMGKVKGISVNAICTAFPLPIARKAFPVSDTLMSGQLDITFDRGDTAKLIKGIFDLAEQMVRPIGGEEEMMRYIAANVKYPKGETAEGKVLVRLTVLENGAPTEAEVIKSLSPKIDQEAIRVCKTLHFMPGKQANQLVKMHYSLPVIFNRH